MDFKFSAVLGADRATRWQYVRQKAEECRQLAETALSETTRDNFLDLARSYDALAADLEAKQRRRARRKVSPSP
jgi:hypothetical protein